ncbi:hypothetical protein RINTU1_16080 [Candidatus Regiella insecticola]|uniref:Uncharacterized protein n=1 Tax=Candidatus Regiella insecticola TaxID=138073 RepID=A0A6L2ZNI9_9ENTR|nr:hypothetical protein RINTU1_16080 [Candidatus Regiella insecticola]
MYFMFLRNIIFNHVCKNQELQKLAFALCSFSIFLWSLNIIIGSLLSTAISPIEFVF